MAFVAWHNQTLTDHLGLTKQYEAQGYGFISLSVYGSTSSPYYAAVMVQPSPAAQHHYPAVPVNQWQQLFNQEAGQGYGPTMVAATGSAVSPLYAAVFEPQDPIPLTINGIGLPIQGWQAQTLNNNGKTGGPSAAGGLFVSVYNDQQHFAYLDGSGNIQDAWYSGDEWQLQQINNGGKTKGPAAAGSLFVSVYNNQQHFTYVDTGGNIHDAWYGNGGWQIQQLNNGGTVDGPAAVGGLFVSVYNDQQHFTYLDGLGNIQDAWYGNDGWHTQRLNNGHGGQTDGPDAVGGLFVSVYNDQQHFTYLDDGDNLQDIWYGSDGWHVQRLNNGHGGKTDGPAAAGGPFVSVYNDQQHFAYLDGLGNLQDIWYGNDGWHVQQLNNGHGGKTDGPAAVGGPFVCVYDDQQHFAYLDGQGNLQDAWYGNGGWHVQQLNNGHGGKTDAPAAVGGPFVCVYGDQQHFAYLDGGGNVQDVWYSTYVQTLAVLNALAKSQGLILRWAASYGDSMGRAFVAIWIPNSGQTLWNNDGVSDSASGYQARFDAEASGWCRPAFVTLNTNLEYLSIFVDNQIGPLWANHELTSAQYQSASDTLVQQGFFPICVQAAGPDPDFATFSAIFAKSQQVVGKQFSATGPVANAQIDAVIAPLMQTYGVRHAALAIVHDRQLVYARAYTLAEPDWPVAQPTTCFRLASVSKVPTAVAIYQLIQAGTLKLGDSLQGILQLTTPSGGPPVDLRFNQITIQQLLEHKSGLIPDGPTSGAFDDGVAVAKAFPTATLPVSAPMTDSYIASLRLQSNPGATQVYNNCGYYLLARVVAKLRGQSRPIDAYQQYLFNPLSITRIRRAVSLVADQPPDEARYQDYDLIVDASQMSEPQPLVPDMYGDLQLEIMEGSGGLTGAVPDVARLIAILISQQDNPASTRATLVNMLSAGAALSTAGFARAGYGFDFVSSLGGGQFDAQKGGLWDSSSSILSLNGEWGFTMLWGSGRPGQLPNQPWASNFPAVMNIATSTNWGSDDLFPQFGMPSL